MCKRQMMLSVRSLFFQRKKIGKCVGLIDPYCRFLNARNITAIMAIARTAERA